MINITINNSRKEFSGDKESSLLKYLREDCGLIAAKDGCSGEGTCGACLVEIDGKAKLSCRIKMGSLNQTNVITLEGVPTPIKQILGNAFVSKGATQCGFCTPGFIMRTKVLLQNNPSPTREEIKTALSLNLCRCTGYTKIIEAIGIAAEAVKNKADIELNTKSGKIGQPYPKYDAYLTAIGERKFTDDLSFEGMLFGALKFSDYPRAKILSVNTSKAEKIQGVIRVFTAKDIPGQQNIGLIFPDWPLMIGTGQITNYIGDVLAGVVAETNEIARKAAELIEVEYEILPAVTDVHEAVKDAVLVHPGKSNILENCKVSRGNVDKAIRNAHFLSSGVFQTQRIEHGFLEKEAVVARTWGNGGIELYSQGQGVYEDRRQVALILGIPEEKVRVALVPNGGGFGGKEDLTVQGHAALFAFLLGKTVKLTLSRPESIRMHPKRHPVTMNITVGCDENGMLTAVKLRAVGDTGAYASVGTKVMERVAGHCTGGYYVPAVDLEALTVYTNNIPNGAMRGFGANQVTFALESCIDELCEKGGFDRWQFRYDNALTDGLMTSTGQVLQGVGIRECLKQLKPDFYHAKYAGLSCAIKNSGVGNGMADFSNVKIEIKENERVVLHHGWTEMGQGVHNMALQTLCEETGISPDCIEVVVDTEAQIKTGMTTSSRATALVGNAIIDCAKALVNDMQQHSLKKLAGRTYKGGWTCDWTTKPGADVEEIITHYSYGYAAQLCILDENGKIEKFIAAHDAGKIMNPILFEGQIEGAVHMGLGYALSEDLPMKDGFLISSKLKDCKILRARETPDIEVRGVEVKDPVGPYGAKGIGEIGLVPTAAAVANAFYKFDGIRRYSLPLQTILKENPDKNS